MNITKYIDGSLIHVYIVLIIHIHNGNHMYHIILVIW
jgi:hypothetical protein